MAPKLLQSPTFVFTSTILLRAVLLTYSHWQDTHSPVKYTDIDYLVFTDAARFVSRGQSPYDRETYRYTPLLAWILTPTVYWFDFGKVLFALGDVLAGWLLMDVLVKHYGVEKGRATSFAAVWALNPMVANISTRGSSEALLGVLAIGLLKAGLERRIALAGIILGFSVHWKIYPFIYAASLIWWMDRSETNAGSFTQKVLRFWNGDRIRLAIYSFGTFMGFNALMFYMYVLNSTSTRLVTNIPKDTVLHTSSIRGHTISHASIIAITSPHTTRYYI
jgi:phosphatidylinositol glycan class M